MAFRPLLPTTVRWRPLEGDGLEHLTVIPLDHAGSAAIRAAGIIIGARGGTPYGVSYRIDCSAGWAVLSFSVETTDGRRLALLSDGKGHWRTEEGESLPQFDGCVDIDLYGSPFTNSLPIRRLEMMPQDGTAKLSMLYIPFDTFEPVRDGQHYTCIVPEKLYRYAAEDRDFTVDLPVDEDGLVVDYPIYFRRVDV
ncbi:putative glycolipid-binding domain-containing protein [Rhizobium sp. 11515TR]|uniref:putative glycolipid-binding domain-containing protein n=1 Tax=Rhizobium sp. 11515TR TaxID=2028343 RepID=UPI000BA86516|nr:putative glycolipid-binding domain-containing protein [Rhizobium sp. 11515TR]ASW07544.1 transcriptional regulator [Rhizobium sp. 11515TR]